MKKIISVILTLLIAVSCATAFGMVEVNATQSRTENFSKSFSLSGSGSDDIVSVAAAQLGKTGSQLGYSEQWCADFVSDCAKLANQSSAIPASGICTTLRSNIIKAGGDYVDKYSAQKGDIVFYGNNGADHVEIVYAASNGNVSTYGGNSGSGSSLYARSVRQHPTQTQSIAYIVRPKYSEISKPTDNYVDIGTDFYAYIINTFHWKHLTNDGDNVSMRSETGEANQVWRFERQSDLSYKIINCKDNKCLDVQNGESKDGSNVQVYDSNDTNAQRWFVLGESGSYYLKSKCGECILDVTGGYSNEGTNIQVWSKNDTSAQKFQIWKLNKAGSTYCSVAAGTNYIPTSIWWNNASDTLEYDVKIWKGTVWQGEAYKVLWGQKDTSCVVNLPEGYYEAYVDCRNKYSQTMSENIIKFTVTKGEPVNVGENIYAGILVYKNWVNVANVNKNAELLSDTSQNPNKIWNFIRQSDGSYMIINCGSGKALDVYCAGNENGTNVQLCDLNYSDAQKWYIYGRWSGEFYLKPKCSDKVLNINGGNNNSGDNVELWELNYSDAQKFAIYGIDKAEKTSVKFSNDEASNRPTLKWEQAKGATDYQVKIYDNNDNLVIDYTTKNLIYTPALTKGEYKATVISKNYYSNSISDYISFNIEKGALIGDTDNDGVLSVNDATQIQMYLSFTNDNDGKPIINISDEYELAIADFNKDNAITVADVTAIQMAIVNDD